MAHCRVDITGAKAVRLSSSSEDYEYSVSVTEYPSLHSGGEVKIADNKTSAYNKVYFTACENERVSKGDKWHSQPSFLSQKAEKSK